MATDSVNLDNERTFEKNMMIDGRDDEIREASIQIISQFQSHGSTNGHYLKIKSNDANKENLTVTANGSEDDPATHWTAYFTLDDNLEQIVILKNNHFSNQTKGKCVLFTRGKSDDYVLGVKRITEIPKRLLAIDPSIGFYKEPRAIGSEMISLKSALRTTKTLFVGFDAFGLPIPLNKVDKDSPYLQAYFKIIPC